MRPFGSSIFLLLLFIALPSVGQGAVKLGTYAHHTEDSESIYGENRRLGGGLSYFHLIPLKRNQFDSADGGMAGLEMALGMRYGAELAVGRYTQDTKTDNRLSKGTSTITPIMVTLRFGLFRERAIMPYFSVGAGYFLIRHDLDEEIKNE